MYVMTMKLELENLKELSILALLHFEIFHPGLIMNSNLANRKNLLAQLKLQILEKRVRKCCLVLQCIVQVEFDVKKLQVFS